MPLLLADRYELGEQLGLGGMAEVVRGVDVRLHRPVAVKLMAADRVDAATRERFRREARASARFSHPHVVTTFDAGEDAGWLYLVMELVEGPTLAEHLKAVTRLEPATAVGIAGAVLDALSAAHEVGLVHRDVKPGNVLLGRDGSVKLADFGIARRFDEVGHDLTATGTFIGTARYASPEQLGGQPATAASDLYSAGIVLYEMLAGRSPFDGQSAVALAMAHQQAPVPDVRAVVPEVPRGLADAITRAMAKGPSQRFRSADAMRAAIESGVAHASTRTSPTTARSAAATQVLPTRVERTVDGPGRAIREQRPQRWWWIAAAALIIVGTATVAALGRDRSPPADSATTIQPGTTRPAATLAVPPSASTIASDVAPAPVPTSPRTTMTTTTSRATTGSAATAPPGVDALGSVDELKTLIAGDPDRFGSKAGDVVNELERMNGGNGDAPRARQLLERTRDWVEEGQLEPLVLELMEPLLTPLVAERNNNGQRRND